MSIPSGPDTTGVPGPPPHPLDEMWYVAGDTQALGPFRGRDLKAMIERGTIGAHTAIAKVGAQQWTALADVAALARFLPPLGAPAGPPPPPRPTAPTSAPFAAGHVAASQGVHYAGFWIRLLAYLVDSLAMLIILMVVSLPMGAIVAAIGPNPKAAEVLAPLWFLVEVAAILIYQSFFVGGAWQATPGKRLCRIYIIRLDGQKVGPGLAIGRYLASLLSAIILYIGFIMIAFTDQKKGLHDIVCDTRVIYGKT